MYGLDALSGELLWHGMFHDRQWPLPFATVTSETVYINSGINRILAIDIRTGDPRWTVATRSERAWVELSGDTVYLNDEVDTLVALDAASGSERWRFHSPVARPRITISAYGLVLVEAGPILHALSEVDGTETWRLVHGNPDVSVTVNVATIGASDIAYVTVFDHFASSEWTLYAVELRTGLLLWRMSGSHKMSIQITGDKIYLATPGLTVAIQQHPLTSETRPDHTPSYILVDESVLLDGEPSHSPPSIVLVSNLYGGVNGVEVGSLA